MSLVGIAALLLGTRATAQEIVTDGPPPALRKNMDAFMKAFNTGDAAQFETMAKTVFTADYLKKQTAEERKKTYTKMWADFGTIQITQVERRGMDAPLQVFVKGSVASGVLWIALDDASKFDSLKPEPEKKTLHAHRPD